MKSPREMSRNELLELAALDAYGLLDEFETDLFASGFDQALPELQDEAMELQAALAVDKLLLSAEEPPASLRQRVLERVALAIEKQAPIATIGPRHSTIERADRLRYGVGSSAQLWRAAAFVLAAASIIMAYFYTEAYRHNHEITLWALDSNTNATTAQLEQEIGPTFRDFMFDPDVEHIALAPATGSGEARGLILVNRETCEAIVVFDGLSRTETTGYTICVVDAAGEVEEIQAFRSSGSLGGFLLKDLSAAALAAVAWQITDHESGDVLLRGA